MLTKIAITVRYPKGYDGPSLPVPEAVLLRGGRAIVIDGRHAIRLPFPYEHLALIDGERLTLEKINQLCTAWTRLSADTRE